MSMSMSNRLNYIKVKYMLKNLGLTLEDVGTYCNNASKQLTQSALVSGYRPSKRSKQGRLVYDYVVKLAKQNNYNIYEDGSNQI